MADTKISGLPAVTTPAGTDEFAVNQAGSSKKVTLAQVQAYALKSGTAVIDFGAHPGATHATVAVTGQTDIVAGSIVEAWIRPEATADHSADEHMVEALRAIARDISAGVGFTIHGVETHQETGGKIYGQWTVAWTWK